MSEYERDYKDQIHSDFAFRLGKIVNQYDRTEFSNEHFEVTLYICVLQNLLTNCLDGILRSAEDRTRPLLTQIKPLLEKTIDGENPTWGLESSFIKVNTFSGDLKVRDVIERMRHSLSHPAQLRLNEEYPSSGYTTIPNETKIISKICFVNSPDVVKNRPRLFNNKEDVQKYIESRSLGNLNLYPKKVSNCGYGLFKDEKPFTKIFRVDLPVKNLKTLVTELSNNLSVEIAERNKIEATEQQITTQTINEDPISRFGKNPVSDEINDASINYDQHLI